MNLRKTLSGFVLLTLVTPLVASPSGFFVGGILGVTALKGEHTYTTKEGSGINKLNKIAPQAGLNAGYLVPMQDGKMCIGAEIYTLLGGSSVKKDLSTKSGPVEGRYNISTKGTIGASIITGMMLNPRLMAYARVGYEMSSLEFKYSDLSFELPHSKTYKKKTTGIAPGGGILFRITPQLSMMLDATIPVLKKTTVRSKDANGRSMEYSPSTQRVTCRIIYTF